MAKESGKILSSLADREKTIVRTSIIGVITNVFLAAFKAAVGIISNSIAVVLDAVNNMADALSSVVTIIGAKLSSKKPDREHPLGYGRIEYLSSMAVAAIVLYAGITSLVESVKKIISPEAAEYSLSSVVILAVAIVVKLFLGSYVRKQGREIGSGALVASGSEALFDAILSASVLASVAVYLLWGISLEAFVGVVISLFIIRTGIEVLTETANEIIGKRVSAEMAIRIKRLLSEEPEVRGAYDLTMFNYGPDRYYSSVHIELPDTMTVEETDRLTRRLQNKIYQETGVVLTGIGVYSYNTKDDEAAHIRAEVLRTVMSHDWALQLHGFYVDTTEKTMRFDTVLSFDVDHSEAIEILTKEISEMYPDYSIQIVPDVDQSDLV